MTKSENRPIYPIHPGSVLKEELAELHMTAAQLARELHVPPNRIYQILIEKRPMTGDIALRLEQWLGVSADFWMNLQKSYELYIAAEQLGAEIKRTIQRREPITDGHSVRV